VARGSGAGGHCLHLPEVTFCSDGIARTRRAAQHGAMSLTNHRVLHPLNLAGVATVFAIGLSLR